MGKIIFDGVEYTGGSSNQVETMPQASVDNYLHIYQYVGDTTTEYKKGYFYICIIDPASAPPNIRYIWVPQNVQDGGGIIDEAMSDTSENAVQNKVITAALNEKAALTIRKISTAGGGEEIHATVAQDQDAVDINYYKDDEIPDYINLNIGEDSFMFKTAAALADDAKISIDPTSGIASLLSESFKLIGILPNGDTRVSIQISDSETGYSKTYHIPTVNLTPFIATYETTTYDEVKAAIDADRAIVVNFPNNNNLICVTYATYTAGQDIVMSGVYKFGDNIFVTNLTLTPESVWSISNTGIQEKLSSGQNIKTINNQSIIGSGNIDIGSSDFVRVQIGQEGSYQALLSAIENGSLVIATDNSLKYIALSVARSSYETNSPILLSFGKSENSSLKFGVRGYVVSSDDQWKPYSGVQSMFSFDGGYGTGAETLISIPYGYQDSELFGYLSEFPNDVSRSHIIVWEDTPPDGELNTIQVSYAIEYTSSEYSTVILSGVVKDNLIQYRLKIPHDYSTATWEKTVTAIANADHLGNLSSLATTEKTNLVGAINEVYEKSGEPFRVKQWATNSLNVTIPTCTTDVANTSIPKLEYNLTDEEGANYQIVGMIAYEVFDAASGGNRINCWPVCQFTGNGQKQLSVRFMCAGTQPQVAKRISAWVLLKHR